MKQTVLVAEDENFLRDLIRMDLEEHDLDVRLAANGEETIRAIAQHPPAVLLLDLLMPKVDGYEVLKHIRQHGYSFPVIILSNLSDPGEQEKCMQLGAAGFLIKSNIDESMIWDAILPYLRT